MSTEIQQRAISALGSVAFRDWRFFVGMDESRAYLQVVFEAPCAVTGEASTERGRKWLLSPYMTDSEIVQTAFKAVLTAQEHEAREHFTYCGEAIFGPHFDVDDLVVLAKTRGRAGARPQTASSAAKCESLKACPKCGASPFDQFLPLTFYRSGFRETLRLLFGKRSQWSVICRDCKEIVGYETHLEWFEKHVAVYRSALPTPPPGDQKR